MIAVPRRAGILILLSIVVVGAFFVARRYAINVARPRVTKALTGMAKYGDVDYDDLTVDLIRRVVHVWNLRLKPIRSGATIAVRDLAIQDFVEGDPIPTGLDIALRGVSVDNLDVGSYLPVVDREILTGDSMVGDVRLAYRYVQNEEVLRIQALELGIEHLARVHMGGEFIQVALPSVRVDGEPLGDADLLRGLSSALDSAALGRFELTYEDRGLLARAFILAGAGSAESATELAKQVLGDLGERMEEFTESVPAETSRQFTEFLSHPGTLQLTVEPKVPIPIARFLVGAMLGEQPKLDLSIETSAGPALSDTIDAQVAHVRDKLEQVADRAMDEFRWADAAVALGRARTMLPNDQSVIDLENQLTLRSGIEFDIRNVDFRSFSYQSPQCVRAFGGSSDGLRDPIQVSNGRLSVGSGPAEVTFRVDDVLYGDLNGDGVDDAVVVASCGQTQTSARVTQLYIYALQHGGPALLASLPDEGVVADYRRFYGGSLWPPLFVHLAGQRLIVAGRADGSRASPAHDVEFQYGLTPSGLRLVARPERREFGAAGKQAARR